MSENIEFKPHAAPNVHETVTSLLKGEKGKMIDIGAGEGELIWRLKGSDFVFRACDINPEKFKLKNAPCDRVDANEKFPYESRMFDVVTCVEVLEHLNTPYTAISEIGRILKPNGIAVITTPNIMNWYSRLRFLKDGVFNNYFLPEEFTKNAKLGHVHPFYYPQLLFFMEKNELFVETLTADICYSLSNRNMGRITKGFIFYFFFHFIMKPDNPVLMEGNTLIIKCRKRV